MGFKQETNDPIIGKLRKGTAEDPYKRLIETLQVSNGAVALTELPNRFDKVKISGLLYPMYETNKSELSENTYRVDYTQGVVFFHSDINKQFLVFDYIGRGAQYFPSSRVYMHYNGVFWTVEKKILDLDREILVQKSRVDTLIREVPQPSEVIDTRIDYNGKIFPVAKDRIDSEQKKIEEAYYDLNNIKHMSLKDRIDSEQEKIEGAYYDADGKRYDSLKDRFNWNEINIKNNTTHIKNVEKKNQDIINLNERFGITGDGKTDYTQQFLEAEAEKKPLFLLPGTYRAMLQDLTGWYFGEGATLIVKERSTFHDTTPPSQRTGERTVVLSNVPQPILNEFYGKNSGKNIQLEGYTNTGVGESSLSNIRTGKQNTAVGFQSQSQNESQYSNVSMGSDSLSKGKFFSRTVAIGSNSLKWAGITDPIESRHELWLNEKDERDLWNIPGSNHYHLKEMNPDVDRIIKPNGVFPKATSADEVLANVGIGRNSLLQLVKGSHNVSIGYQSLANSYTTDDSVAVGSFALASSLKGNSNVAIGKEAMRYNQVGFGNVSMGYRALANEVFGSRNTMIGHNAGRDMRGNKDDSSTLNVMIGAYSGEFKTDGQGNVAIGARTMVNGGDGSRNVVIGTEAGQDYAGNNSIIIGNKATPNVNLDRLLWIDYGNDDKTTPFIYGDMYNEVMNVRADFRPSGDNKKNLGQPSRRWNTLYAGTGTINTSDRRKKQQISTIPDEWLDAWEEVEYTRFKFNESVEEKGNEARWHIGLIAQEIYEVFEKHNLDAFEVGILCYDKWDEESVDILDKNGNPTGEKTTLTPAGDIWGIRADECQFLEMALMRRELKRLKDKNK